MNILISACLLGMACRYDGKSKSYPQMEKLVAHPQIHVIPVCPEQAGGLATPRPPAERCGDTVITSQGRDVTAQYKKGAREACRLAEMFHCSYAVLKEKSPSCGCGKIYDGSFSRTLTAGDGVTAAALKQKQVIIVGESEAERVLESLFF